MNAYMMNVTSMSSNGEMMEMAKNWGSAIDMTKMPADAYDVIAENVMYTRTYLAANPDMMNADGSVNINAAAPMMVPQDVSVALSANAPPASAPGANGAASSASAAPTAAAAAGATNGARGMAASTTLASVAAFAVALLVL